MPRFYLHYCDALGRVTDQEGAEYPDVSVARTKAVAAAREIIAGEVEQGQIDLTATIEVMDESGHEVLLVRFGDAVEVRP
jgi:hypothetical protein